FSRFLCPHPPRPTSFPYTTLFRSEAGARQSLTGSGRVDAPAVDGRAPQPPLPPAGDPAPEGVGGLQPDGDRRGDGMERDPREERDRKSTRLNSSHQIISYAVFCLK